MPVLKYLADTNIVSDYFRPGNPVKDWFARHRGEIGISTLTLNPKMVERTPHHEPEVGLGQVGSPPSPRPSPPRRGKSCCRALTLGRHRICAVHEP